MAEFGKIFAENFSSHSKAVQDCANSAVLCAASKRAAKEIAKSIRMGGKILICGNGGSASDANHLAAEFINRYKKDRAPLPAISLSSNPSDITSIGNDYSFDLVFSKQVEALGRSGDVLIAISTSGKSKNIIEALKSAKAKKVYSILFTGDVKTVATDICDLAVCVNSKDTPRIQEMHLILYHCICEFVESELFEK